MMEFIAGLGIGLCVGIVGTMAAIIWMRDQGYEIVRTEKLTGREAETLDKKLEEVQGGIKAQAERIDALNGLLEDSSQTVKELADAVKTDHDRLEKLVDVVALQGDE